jgi:hypothetical protein
VYGWAPRCVQATPDISWMGKRVIREKNKQQILSFVSPARTNIIMCTYNVGVK